MEYFLWQLQITTGWTEREEIVWGDVKHFFNDWKYPNLKQIRNSTTTTIGFGEVKGDDGSGVLTLLHNLLIDLLWSLAIGSFDQ